MTIYKFLISCLLCTTLYCVEIEQTSKPEQRSKPVQELFKEHNINLASKSYKGWVRVILSEEKRINYNLTFIDKNNIEVCIHELISLDNNKLEGKLK